MAAQQWDDMSTLCIHHQDCRVLVFALDERCNQTGHSTNGAHHHKSVSPCPVLLQGGLKPIGQRDDPVDQAAVLKSL